MPLKISYTNSLQVLVKAGNLVFSERELMFIANVNSCSCSLYVAVCLSVCLSSVTFVHPTQPIEIFGNVSVPCNALVT